MDRKSDGKLPDLSYNPCLWWQSTLNLLLTANNKNNKTEVERISSSSLVTETDSAEGITDQQDFKAVIFWNIGLKNVLNKHLQSTLLQMLSTPKEVDLKTAKKYYSTEVFLVGEWVPSEESQFIHWLFNRVWVSLSGLHLEEALELEGHHLPVVTGAYWEGHPVAGGFGQHAGRGWLAELRPCVAWTSLCCQERVEVRHCTLPVLIIGGKADRSILLCRRGLPRLRRPVVCNAFVTSAVTVMMKATCPSCRSCYSVLVTASLLSPAKLMVLLWQRALRVGNWNVISLSTSHAASALRVTSLLSESWWSRALSSIFHLQPVPRSSK